MSDKIILRELEVRCRIGVPDRERARPQRLMISLEMEVPSMRAAAGADDVALAVDYFPVYQAVKKIAATRPRRLLETLAEEIAGVLLNGFPIRRVQVEVRKFIFKDADSVGVRIVRSRRLRRRP